MRRAPSGQTLTSGYQNGQVIQVFHGTPTGAGVTSSAATFGTAASTGYPANSPFVKLLSDSLLDVAINCDFTGPSSPPTTVWVGLVLDGSDLENIAVTAPDTGSEQASDCIHLRGLKWSKGSHTVEVKFWNSLGKSMRLDCNGSCDFTIVEYI